MDYVSDANELIRRLRSYAFTGVSDADLALKLQSLPGSSADQLCDGAETLYAHRDLLDEAGLRVMGELYNYAIHQGWTGFNQGDRSDRIVGLVRRDLGERGAGVSRKTDQWPEPQINRRKDGIDWRAPVQETAAPLESS